MSSESDFSVYRGFAYLHLRGLLALQQELDALEEELHALDAFHDQGADSHLPLMSYAADKHRAELKKEERPRSLIIADIQRKLLEYG